MKRSIKCLTLMTGLLAASLAHGRELPHYDAYQAAPAVVARPGASVRERAARAGGAVVSLDARRGVPSFVWAAPGQKAQAALGATPEVAARAHLARFAGAYGVPRAALRGAEVVRTHDTGQGGVIVTLRQRVGGVELFRQDVKVLMRQDLSLVAIAGSPHPDAAAAAGAPRLAFRLPAEQALLSTLHDLYGVVVPRSAVVDAGAPSGSAAAAAQGPYRHFTLGPAPALAAAKLGLARPARVKQVFFALPDRLVPAYYVEVFAGPTSDTSSDAYAVVIAADDGRVLYRQDLTAHDAFNYRVWAEVGADGRPLDGPQADHTPHPTGIPDGSVGAFIPPALVSMEGFNTSPENEADPWLSATAVQTLGNNVDAYADHNAPDGYSNSDLRATTTSDQTFDRVYDTSAGPLSSQDQSMAAVTELFYVNNWLHDWYYDSGFTEAAGNAQQNNFGRGGLGSDPLHVEAQDGALTPANPRNNANMSTPADGASPRMQMYLWTGSDVIRQAVFSPIGLSPATGPAGFGPTDFNVTAPLVLGNDGVVEVTNGCEPFVNVVAGQIVLVDRGSCSFKTKTLNAQTAGAAGVIIANNVPGAGANALGNDSSITEVITIPTLSVPYDDGVTLKTALQGGPITTTMERQIGIERDGTIDNAIVAHEWGHYFHHRLADCGGGQCRAQSEGWGDFVALHMVVREGDDLNGAYGIAIYSTDIFGDEGYFGIRRAPYSLDFSKNGFSFRHIADGEALPGHPVQILSSVNSEVHNAGEVWTAMLWEAYAELIKQSLPPNPATTFDEARRLMSDYVVAGLMMAPTDATFTEQRDAILAAAGARSEPDMLALADGFARRGAGTCAVSPDRYSTDFVGVVESFEVRPRLEVVSIKLDDGVRSCDGDGALDAEEVGRLTVEVMNVSPVPLTDAELSVSSTHAEVSFTGAATAPVPAMAPFGMATVTFDAALSASVAGREAAEFEVTATSSSACGPVTAAFTTPINLDDVAASSALDDVESGHVPWSVESVTGGDLVWERVKTDPLNHAWYTPDWGSKSDVRLESPDLVVSATDDLVLKFDHVHSFETGPEVAGGPDVYWDGGVIEITEDGGATWADVSATGDPGYGGVFYTGAGNPLSGRQGYVSQNASFPMTDPVSINLGTAFAGKTVRVRFRLGTDAATGDVGWLIDNIELSGIDNTPFGSLTDDQTLCQAPPLASAGEDQTVVSGDEVALDASASSDPNGDPLAFAWTQTAGPTVSLLDSNKALSMFKAPAVAEDTTLTFRVAVSDGMVAAATDTVDILVQPAPPDPAGSGGSGGTAQPPPEDGCGCSVVGDDDRGAGQVGALWALLAGAIAGLRRRRRRGCRDPRENC